MLNLRKIQSVKDKNKDSVRVVQKVCDTVYFEHLINICDRMGIDIYQ